MPNNPIAAANGVFVPISSIATIPTAPQITLNILNFFVRNEINVIGSKMLKIAPISFQRKIALLFPYIYHLHMFYMLYLKYLKPQ